MSFDSCWSHPSFVNISSTLVIDTSMERSSSTSGMETKKFYFLFKILQVEIEIWLVLKCWNHPIISVLQYYLIDTPINRSSPIWLDTNKTNYRNPKIRFCFLKMSKLNRDLYFDLCRSTEITLASSISVLQ